MTRPSEKSTSSFMVRKHSSSVVAAHPASSVASEFLSVRTKQIIAELKSPTGANTVDAPDAKRSIEHRLFDARSACKITTRQMLMHFPTDWHKKFFAQLDNLLDIDEWDDRDEPVTKDSFFTLIRLMVMLKDKRRPGIGIANHGNIVATWTVGPKDRLTIECLPNDRVYWLATIPVDDGSDSVAGDASLSKLLGYLQPYSPDHWLTNEDIKQTPASR